MKSLHASTNTTQAFTPGPWDVYADIPSTEPNWHIVTNANRRRVLANVHIEPGNKTDLANARLIVAAPELLLALQWLYAICLRDQLLPDTVSYMQDAEKAIAKALGRSEQANSKETK